VAIYEGIPLAANKRHAFFFIFMGIEFYPLQARSF